MPTVLARTVRTIELAPIKERPEDFEPLEARIRKAFLDLLYRPLMRELLFPRTALENAKRLALEEAIATGKVTYSKGAFRGTFNAEISRELKALGAKWVKGAWQLAELPPVVQAVVSTSEARFRERMRRVDVLIAKNLPEDFAERVKAADLFDSRLFATDRKVEASLKGLTVLPKLTKEQCAKIADEWQNNLDRWIKDFAAKEITQLRKDVALSVAQGNRREHLEQAIRRSYGVTASKAKFLAKQETSLLMTKFKEARYTSAGVTQYRWGCVAGSALHPVRPSHKALEGKVFSWDAPPITTAPGEPARRNNPGEDFGCRCFAKPVVRF